MQFTKTLGGFLSVLAIAGTGFLLGSYKLNDDERSAIEPAVEISTMPSRIAITVDDLPYVPRSKTSTAEGQRYVNSIIQALRKHDIVATGFAVGQQVDAETRPALQAFVDAGHTIGNHSWSHADYDSLTQDEFRDETARTHQVLSKWITGPRYYRFPYLSEGETEQAKTDATAVLTELGYQNVPVTIDNDEWKYNAEYLDVIKRGDAKRAAEVARQYIAHMQERTLHFQNLAQDALGGDVDHILLIHLNGINADHFETLLDWYADQGWSFITVKEAMRHPVFSMPDLYTGSRGISQIERVLGRAGE